LKARYLLYLLCPLLLALPLPGGATPALNCSIHVANPATPAELQALATVSKKDAETIALANLTRKPAGAGLAKLEVDKDCLVWSFEYKREKKPGLIQVLVDAGNGKFLLERLEKQKDAETAKRH